ADPSSSSRAARPTRASTSSSTGPTTPSRWATWRANSSTDPPSCRRAASRSSGADARRPRPAARARGGDARHGDVRDAVFVVRLARTNEAEALVPGLEVRLRVQVDDRLRAAQLDAALDER